MIEVRGRLTERLSGARLRLEARRSGPNFLILLAAVGVAIAGMAWVISNIASTLIRDSNEVAFEVGSGRAVKPGLNEVRVKGIPAGRVTSVELVDGRPVVKVKVEKEYGRIYQDARAELRPNSALEDQFIDIVDRGTPAAGEADPDEPLPPTQTETPVGVDEVLNTFTGNTRARLRVLLDDLGRGLDDNGAQLGQAFAAAVPLIDAAGRLTDQLARRAPLTERLIHNTGVLTAELGDRETQLRTLVRDGATTLSALQESSVDLDATLAELPGTLTATDRSFAATRGVLGDVDTAVRRLQPVADELEPALRAVERLGEDALPAVRALRAPVTRLVPLARTLVPLSANLSDAIARLRPQIPVLDRTTKNLADCEKGVQGFFQWDASMTKFGDVRGQAPRGNLAVGAQSAGIPSPDEKAYEGCVKGTAIGGRPPVQEDMR